MAYVDQSSNFGYGVKLTATQMQNLRDNLAAFAAQDSGAPDISAVIDQTALKTDTEEETADVATATETTFEFSSVGEYGFYPRTYYESSTTGLKVYLKAAAGHTSYATTITILHTSGGAKNCYAQIRYVTASGEIYWLFILQDKETKKYIRMHGCPDHPAICCHDPETIHHPFFKAYDPEKHNIFCVPLSKSERKEVEDMREWKNELPGLSFLEAVKKYYDIDENPKDAKWPTIPVTIGVDRHRRPMKAKIPKRDYIKQAALVRKK
jgi:hypothetical protein